jgi:hypothetical protein
MRRFLETIVLRLFRSRIGVALVLVLFVLGVVGAARLVAGPATQPAGVAGVSVRPISTVDPTAGDDGLHSTGPPPSPSTRPGADPPEKVARAFALAWLDHRETSAQRWHDRLADLSTTELQKKLAGADPSGVPADRLVGEPVVVAQTEKFVEVLMDLDAGRLRLELVGPDGRWRVDAVDWERT